jgi:hypothetical protein
MEDVVRLLLLLAFAGVALTVMGALAIRFMDEGRRIRRGLKTVLKAPPHAWLVARGRGKGVGFNFNTDMLAVAWDSGGWCLLYKIEELTGAELIIDGEVTARSHRGEPRRALDLLLGADKEVRLRLIFDDPRHPDFDLVLWKPEDEARPHGRTAGEAVHEANSWIARTEALFRRPGRPREVTVAPPPIAAALPLSAPPTAMDEYPPWEDDDEPELAAEDEDEDEDAFP